MNRTHPLMLLINNSRSEKMIITLFKRKEEKKGSELRNSKQMKEDMIYPNSTNMQSPLSSTLSPPPASQNAPRRPQTQEFDCLPAAPYLQPLCPHLPAQSLNLKYQNPPLGGLCSLLITPHLDEVVSSFFPARSGVMLHLSH